MIKYRVTHRDGFEEFKIREAAEVFRESVGGEISEVEYTPPPEDATRIPSSISASQMRLALYELGFLDSVEEAVSSQPREVKILWEFASIFRRDDELLNQMANGMGITQEQVDGIFILGADR